MRRYRDLDWLRSEYASGRTVRSVGIECGVSDGVTCYWMRKAGIQGRKPKSRIINGRKTCADCKRDLLLSAYTKKKNSIDGYWHQCRECCKVRWGDQQKRYRSQPCVKEQLAQTTKRWAVDNPERRREISLIAGRKRRRTVAGRIENNMRVGIYNSLKRNSVSKNRVHWEILVGYTVEQLRQHIESQFESWMTWGNWGMSSHRRGAWNIDHKVPITAFNITSYDCEDFRKCWALENLRPLCAVENREKSGVVNDDEA